VVEGGGLENRFPVLRNGGSNPSPSATYAFLRGVNIGGHKKIPMPALRAAFEAIGCRDVRTVLASGNVAFDAPRRLPDLDLRISRKLEDVFGFTVPVIVRTAAELKAMIAADPFRSIPAGPAVKSCITFLPDKDPDRPRARRPKPGRGVRILRVTPGEVFSVVSLAEDGRTPDLMAYVEKVFGPGGTTRTWRTILKLVRDGATAMRLEAKNSERKLTDLANIGKTTAAKLEKIGIRTAEDFLKRDPYDVFHELRTKVDKTLCRCALAGIVGAKKGQAWHKITKASAAEYEKRHPGHRWGPC
jgi:uncharacterized protein (DUF1697 family)